MLRPVKAVEGWVLGEEELDQQGALERLLGLSLSAADTLAPQGS